LAQTNADASLPEAPLNFARTYLCTLGSRWVRTCFDTEEFGDPDKGNIFTDNIVETTLQVHRDVICGS
jgi:hypothetical protein